MRAAVRDRWRRSFLGRVLSNDRQLGVAFVMFVIIQGIAQVTKVEVTPFFLFGMYSDVIHSGEEYTRVTCMADGQLITQAQLPRNAGELFFSTLHRFEELERSGFKDRFEGIIDEKLDGLPGPWKAGLVERLSFHGPEVPAFEAWAVRYLSVALDRPVHTLHIAREKYRYVHHRPVLTHRSELIPAPANPDVER